jgi:hypothetical protein
MDQIQSIASDKPYMTTPGNHDVSCHIVNDAGCPKGHQNFGPYRHRFQMPGGKAPWYSFNFGHVHFVMIIG